MEEVKKLQFILNDDIEKLGYLGEKIVLDSWLGPGLPQINFRDYLRVY